MESMNVGGFNLDGLRGINVVLGKNGCGKSHLLRVIEQELRNRADIGNVRYLSPERGGHLAYDPGIALNIEQNPSWLDGRRRQNQTSQFRQESTALFRRLELLTLREIERDHLKAGYQPKSFDTVVDTLNTLLDRIFLQRDVKGSFKVLERSSGNEVSVTKISSGESELISLGIEFLGFEKEVELGNDAEKTHIFLVDEPDVHLHPDLQDRLAKFISVVLKGKKIILFLATHSTAILSGLSAQSDVAVAFMTRGQKNFIFKQVTDVDRKILPIFGAHPLSNVFNEAPILLVEGEDDERLWQQAVRSSNGKIRLFPCPVNGLPFFPEYESEVIQIINSVYDSARAYSLRDRDSHHDEIEDTLPIIRMRLACRSAENLLLSDEVLAAAETDWKSMQERICEWVGKNASHAYFVEMEKFCETLDRKSDDLKPIRNVLVALISNKPWEVIVGQAIGKLPFSSEINEEEGTLRDFLGRKVCEHLIKPV